ncbi:hypothetical protein DFJ77DRAFT_540554 [Powellomyces hirtus]|nr:hypothetical protein DFJ77DRAFT_540554 [Powellomyces hirtus]
MQSSQAPEHPKEGAILLPRPSGPSRAAAVHDLYSAGPASHPPHGRQSVPQQRTITVYDDDAYAGHRLLPFPEPARGQLSQQQQLSAQQAIFYNSAYKHQHREAQQLHHLQLQQPHHLPHPLSSRDRQQAALFPHEHRRPSHAHQHHPGSPHQNQHGLHSSKQRFEPERLIIDETAKFLPPNHHHHNHSRETHDEHDHRRELDDDYADDPDAQSKHSSQLSKNSQQSQWNRELFSRSTALMEASTTATDNTPKARHPQHSGSFDRHGMPCWAMTASDVPSVSGSERATSSPPDFIPPSPSSPVDAQDAERQEVKAAEENSEDTRASKRPATAAVTATTANITAAAASLPVPRKALLGSNVTTFTTIPTPLATPISSTPGTPTAVVTISATPVATAASASSTGATANKNSPASTNPSSPWAPTLPPSILQSRNPISRDEFMKVLDAHVAADSAATAATATTTTSSSSLTIAIPTTSPLPSDGPPPHLQHLTIDPGPVPGKRKWDDFVGSAAVQQQHRQQHQSFPQQQQSRPHGHLSRADAASAVPAVDGLANPSKMINAHEDEGAFVERLETWLAGVSGRVLRDTTTLLEGYVTGLHEQLRKTSRSQTDKLASLSMIQEILATEKAENKRLMEERRIVELMAARVQELEDRILQCTNPPSSSQEIPLISPPAHDSDAALSSFRLSAAGMRDPSSPSALAAAIAKTTSRIARLTTERDKLSKDRSETAHQAARLLFRILLSGASTTSTTSVPIDLTSEAGMEELLLVLSNT